MKSPTRSVRVLTWVLITLFSCLSLSSCDKDFENGPRPRERHFDFKNECKTIGPPTNGFGYMVELIGTRYNRPMFNPHDADELLYRERGDGFSRIIKYRISTKEKEVFLEDATAVSDIDWGRGGWIAFSQQTDMFLIREDGSDLHKVPLATEGHRCAEPDFNPDGTVVGFPFGGVDGIALYGMYLLYDLETEQLDTFQLYNGSQSIAWSSLNKMSMAYISSDESDRGLGFVDMTTRKAELIFRTADMRNLEYAGYGDVKWSPDGTTIYLTGKGILCYPTDEYKEIRIKKTCESRYYDSFSISPDNEHIVVERVDIQRRGPFSSVLEERHRLFIMDIDGCNERLLLDDE